MVRVLSMPKYSVHVTDMRDGDIAVITNLPCRYTGRVVQRCGYGLISLGLGKGECWSDAFRGHFDRDDRYKVEILPSGTTLEIQWR